MLEVLSWFSKKGLKYKLEELIVSLKSKGDKNQEPKIVSNTILNY